MKQKSFFRNAGSKIVVAASLGLGVSQAFASGQADPTTAVAIAKLINMTDANTAQLIATAALVTLMVTAAGASIVLSRIKKAKSA